MKGSYISLLNELVLLIFLPKFNKKVLVASLRIPETFFHS